jgi:antitoxin MazE
MVVTISRWGNSLGVRLPKSALEDARLEEGDRVDVVCKNGQLIMIKSNRPTLEELLHGMTPGDGHEESFSKPVGNERW